MTALPAKGDLDGTTGGHNQGMFKTAIGNFRDYCAGLFGTGGTPATAIDAVKILDPQAIYNLGISFAVGSNALTATIKDSKGADLSASNPGFVMQRNSSLSNGTLNLRSLTANISTVISSGSTGGHLSTIEGRLYWYLIDNAGTQELAWSNSYQGRQGIYTTTAEGGAGAADSPTLMYSTTARSSVPGRLIATTKDTQTTAGTWTALPSEIISVGPDEPVGKQTVWVPATAISPRITNGAAPNVIELATNKIILRTLDFDQTTQEYAQFQVTMPKSWDLGTVVARFIWTAASGSGGVKWGIQGVVHSDDDALDVAFGSAQEIADTFIVANDAHHTSETAAMTIGGSPTARDLVTFQVYRNPSDGSDTLTADALLLGVEIVYKSDKSDDS